MHVEQAKLLAFLKKDLWGGAFCLFIGYFSLRAFADIKESLKGSVELADR